MYRIRIINPATGSCCVYTYRSLGEAWRDYTIVAKGNRNIVQLVDGHSDRVIAQPRNEGD